MAIARAPRVGILVECGRGGLEDVLCRRICELLRERTGIGFEEDIVPMDSKRNLIQDCDPTTASLFNSGCDRVVILWDERPAWPRKGDRLCWHNDRQDILQNLLRAQVANRPVHLVCIEREFESWLLFDHQMLSRVLSRRTHPELVSPQKNPHRLPDPRGTMKNLFDQHGGWTYVDLEFANKFARHLQTLDNLRRCDTFRRFAQHVLEQMPNGWPPFVYRPRRRRDG